MKTLFLIVGLLSFNSFAFDHCQKYAAKAVSCYEKGQLAQSYDETGENCGSQLGDSKEGIFWLTTPSSNSTVLSEKLASHSYTYVGGQALDLECAVSFINSNSSECSFKMFLSLGTEDGEVTIDQFNCN